jgi:hypothetical protein
MFGIRNRINLHVSTGKFSIRLEEAVNDLPMATLVDPTDRSLLVGIINLGGSIVVAIAVRFLVSRLDWRESVNWQLARLFEKFRVLRDRHGLDTTVEDDRERPGGKGTGD